MKTPLQTLAVRLPAQTIANMKSYAAANGTNVSALVRGKVSGVNVTQSFKKGGIINVNDEVTKNLFVITGSSIVGIMVYKGVNAKLNGLENGNKWKTTPEKVEAISMMSGVGAAVLAGYGINKLLTTFVK